MNTVFRNLTLMKRFITNFNLPRMTNNYNIHLTCVLEGLLISHRQYAGQDSTKEFYNTKEILPT